MSVKKLVPILVVDAIEPCLEFWVDRFGFTKTTEVPHGDRLGFVILERDGHEVMLQSRSSLAEDAPPLADGPYRSVLYFDVDDLNPIRKSLEGVEVVVPERHTPYGATEIFVRDPAGNLVGFAFFGVN